MEIKREERHTSTISAILDDASIKDAIAAAVARAAQLDINAPDVSYTISLKVIPALAGDDAGPTISAVIVVTQDHLWIGANSQ